MQKQRKHALPRSVRRGVRAQFARNPSWRPCLQRTQAAELRQAGLSRGYHVKDEIIIIIIIKSQPATSHHQYVINIPTHHKHVTPAKAKTLSGSRSRINFWRIAGTKARSLRTSKDFFQNVFP
jgi:hypothetical protein